MTSNPNITWDIISNNLDKPWNWWYRYGGNHMELIGNEYIKNKIRNIVHPHLSNTFGNDISDLIIHFIVECI